MIKALLCGLLLLVSVGVYGLDVSDAEQQPNYKMTVAKWMKDAPKQPRFKGEFTVGVVFVDFPDTVPIDGEVWLGEHSEAVVDYFKAYTQGICWPKLVPLVTDYRGNCQASKLFGYYVEQNLAHCAMGYEDDTEGRTRYGALEATVNDYLKRNARGVKPQVTLYVYGNELRPIEELGKIAALRHYYPEKLETSHYIHGDRLQQYRPKVQWGDPLWPSAGGRKMILQATSPTETLIHELGHILGAPDAYHAPEKQGGVPGDPMTLPGGPTGPLFWRWKYCGLLPAAAYPLITTDGEVTLAPRTNRYQAGGAPLGVLIPTAHPHYLLHLEYDPDRVQPHRGMERASPLPSEALEVEGGVHVSYINICQPGSYFGHPDLVYNYRKDDPWLQGEAFTVAAFGEGEAFDATSNPANILPNQLPTGVKLTFGEQTLEGAKVTISLPKQKVTGRALKKSRLPIVELTAVRDVHPGSFAAEMFVRFRGEPLYSERGIVYGPAPHPTIQRNKVWKMEGIGYATTRVVGIPPGTKLYVRAYAKNALGVVYSDREECITIPRTATETPPLIVSTSEWQPYVRLMNFYRVPLGPSALLPVKDEVDYQRIHPEGGWWVLPRHPPTLLHYHRAAIVEFGILEYLGVRGKDFPEDIEKRLATFFNVKDSRNVIRLSKASITPHLEQIRQELAAGRPVVFIRELRRRSSDERVDTTLLDGYREGVSGPELHICFEGGEDSGIMPGRESGWYSPEVLGESIEDACLLFFNPLKK